MAWDHLSVNKPHLVYIILGGFTSLFMLCSSVIKERLYIGEATVATLCGVIFGPHAANLINPNSWGNVDQITLEFSRIVLVVQCFAVGVELPKYYMEKHWRSVVFLLVPVMTFGWLITSLFIWGMFYQHANWLDSLCLAACVTATDPVLASSVVGKGKFAKRVPKHLRDILSAESGCNDGMAFPFIYLALYIIKYKHEPNQVALHWFCITILYECVFGAIYGVTIGYIARRLIRAAHERDYIDRESFLVFYFTLALFCAGSGSLLGMDDLLIGFACGVGFSNDGWFSEKTEETHVSNVIDLLLNLAFFVYFGTIIPWDMYNSGVFGLDVWRLVVIAFLVVFFRRIPAMLALKPLIPDVKTWREALFAGHFGPIGVGAIFVAILARADLEDGPHGGSVPLRVVPDFSFPHDNVIVLIWPITTFLVITSILVHGSSIAVFTLGKHINTLALTMSYSRATEEPHWMDRLPRIQSRSKSSMSLQRSDSSIDNEKGLSSNNLLPLAAAGNFLRRQKESDNPSRSSSRHRSSKSRDRSRGHGGPISRSAISPFPRRQSGEQGEKQERSDSDTLAMKGESSSSSEEKDKQVDTPPDDAQDGEASPAEVFEEGSHTVYEDKDGEVLEVESDHEENNELVREASEIDESKRLGREESKREESKGEDEAEHAPRKKFERDKDASEVETKGAKKDKKKNDPESGGKGWREGALGLLGKRGEERKEAQRSGRKQSESGKRESAPARAYQYGNTIILEDEDGEVIKKIDIPAPEGQQGPTHGSTRKKLEDISKRFGFGAVKEVKTQAGAPGMSQASGSTAAQTTQQVKRGNEDDEDPDDHLVRFTTGGRRMSKAELIDSFRDMDPSKRMQAVEGSNLPELEKREVRKAAREHNARTKSRSDVPVVEEDREGEEEDDERPFYTLGRTNTADSVARQQSFRGEVPWHDISQDVRRHRHRGREGEETAAERRRRLALQHRMYDDDSDDDGTERVPPARPSQPSPEENETAAAKRRRLGAMEQRSRANDTQDDYFTSHPSTASPQAMSPSNREANTETAAERRRREGALGYSREDSDSESEEEEGDDEAPPLPQPPPHAHTAPEPSRPRQRTLRWASNIARKA